MSSHLKLVRRKSPKSHQNLHTHSYRDTYTVLQNTHTSVMCVPVQPCVYSRLIPVRPWRGGCLGKRSWAGISQRTGVNIIILLKPWDWKNIISHREKRAARPSRGPEEEWREEEVRREERRRRRGEGELQNRPVQLARQLVQGLKLWGLCQKKKPRKGSVYRCSELQQKLPRLFNNYDILLNNLHIN